MRGSNTSPSKTEANASGSEWHLLAYVLIGFALFTAFISLFLHYEIFEDQFRLNWFYRLKYILVGFIIFSISLGALSGYRLTQRLRNLALEKEGAVEHLKQIESQLRRSQIQLESKVQQRTSELEAARLSLEQELLARKNFENALQASQENFQDFFDQAPVGYHEINAEGIITKVNHTELAMLGYDRGEMVGKPVWNFNLETVSEQAVRNKLAGRVPLQTFERTYIRKDGTFLPVLLQETLLRDSAGNITGIRTALLDVSARRKAEDDVRRAQKFLHTVIENLPIMVFIKDAKDLRFVLWNKAGAIMTGRSEQQMVGKSDYDLFSKEEADFFTAKDRETLARGQLLEVAAEEFRGLDQQTRILHTKKIPIFDDEGQPQYLVGMSEDITERKHAEEKLKAFAARLEQNNRELQGFAYVASHDLQEPLRKVRAFGDRLKTRSYDALDAEGRDYLERMQNAARRMQTLIEDLLAFSRISTKPGSFTEVDLGRVVREVLSDLEVRLEQSKGTVQAGELPTIEADPTQMRQLFQNLIGNALKFNRKEVPPVITISAALRQGDSELQTETASLGRKYCVMEIKDNGIGFDEKYLDRIFEVFQRLHGRGEYEGTGVGLAICRKIVERHQGQLTARSQPGEGSTFVVTLPVNQVPSRHLYD